jgi:hypothetical protein
MTDYTSASARKLAEGIYGRSIHNGTWQAWRNAIGIKGKRQKIDKDEYLDLCAIAFLKRDNARRKINWAAIEGARKEIQPYLKSMSVPARKLVHAPTGEARLIRGSEAHVHLQAKGLNAPHQSTFYRRIPGFSRSDYYPERMIESIAV